MNFEDITLIIPTLNEGKNIGKLLSIVTKTHPKINIIVADEGSKDDTQSIVRKWRKKKRSIKLLDRKNKQPHGLTASVLDAVLITKTKYFIVIDGDLQHPPEKIKDIAERLEKYDLVVGARKKVANEWKFFRRLMSYIATYLALTRAALTGTTSKDILSGFFGARTKLFQKTYAQNKNSFVPESYKILLDFLKVSKNLKLAHIHYIFGIRKEGDSKIGSQHVYYFLKSLLK